jgi:membrane protein YdbS with pleckstrin-like domain
MRLVTPGDSGPTSINRYLLPHERQVITVRRHPAILLLAVGEVFGGLLLAGVLSHYAGDSSLGTIIWFAWLAVLGRFAWKVAEWYVDYFIVTNQRMIVTSGLITRKVAMMPLSKVTDMSFQRSILGRLLGYGEFVLESAGQDQALRNVGYLPYPEQLYLEVCGMIFPDSNSESDSEDEPEDDREPAHRGAADASDD